LIALWRSSILGYNSNSVTKVIFYVGFTWDKGADRQLDGVDQFLADYYDHQLVNLVYLGLSNPSKTNPKSVMLYMYSLLAAVTY
jgi:hypothetical protein